jgi:hypothetical protein
MRFAQSAWARSRGSLRLSLGASKSADAGTSRFNLPICFCVAPLFPTSGQLVQTGFRHQVDVPAVRALEFAADQRFVAVDGNFFTGERL